MIAKLNNIFARWGIPETLVSDNGPPFFSEEFKSFSIKFGFDHVTSSPYYPQANEEAESGVKIATRILKQDDPCIALMAYRATPIPATGVSPSQLIMGRQIRTTVPMLTSNLLPAWSDFTSVREADKKMKKRYSSAYNSKHGARSLSDLEAGQVVRLKLIIRNIVAHLQLSVDVDLCQDHTFWKLQAGKQYGGIDDIFKSFQM